MKIISFNVYKNDIVINSPTSHASCFAAAGYASGASTSEDKSFVVIKARQVGGQIQVSKKGCEEGIMK